MSEKEPHKQEEAADVEGHKHYLNEEQVEEGEETPDVEGHKRSTSPVRQHSTKHITGRF